MKSILKNAFLNALGTTAYIAGVAIFLSHAEQLFGPDTADKAVIIPIAMLSLLVFSAALTGFLMLGRPVLWYLDGKKKEALSLLAWTLAIFFGLTVVAFVVLFASR